jgi:tetratricopeptide (TPR) repeat protein
MRNATLAAKVAVAFLALTPLSAHACLNDRDSDALAFEATQLPIVRPEASSEAPDIPGIVEVIVGRFPRNPALYYQLRIERCQKELAANPKLLALYDDISVAYDKLGKSGEALSWIEKKRPYIPASDTEALYRYFANAGTFRAHRWLREGAKDERIGELEQAHAEIAKAIALKPDAHFGREAAQLQAMNWILKEHTSQSLAYFIYHSATLEKLRDTAPLTNSPDKTLLGLAGLVVLGNAWESVDVFGALAGQLNKRGDAKVAYLAELRCRELIRAGKKSLFEGAKLPESLHGSGKDYLVTPASRHWLGITNQDNVATKFNELRTEAESWQAARTAFMEARLKTGHHPDTDPHFWDGYQDSSAPSLDIPWHKEASANFRNWLMRYGAMGVFVLFWGSIIGAVIYLVLPTKHRRKR